MRVSIATPLQSYTGGVSQVEAQGSTVGALLADLDVHYPGIRFRMISEQDQIREHIRIFVNKERAHDLKVKLHPDDVVQIITSLSGGA